jgi:hypothetical protein
MFTSVIKIKLENNFLIFLKLLKKQGLNLINKEWKKNDFINDFKLNK